MFAANRGPFRNRLEDTGGLGPSEPSQNQWHPELVIKRLSEIECILQIGQGGPKFSVANLVSKIDSASLALEILHRAISKGATVSQGGIILGLIELGEKVYLSRDNATSASLARARRDLVYGLRNGDRFKYLDSLKLRLVAQSDSLAATLSLVKEDSVLRIDGPALQLLGRAIDEAHKITIFCGCMLYGLREYRTDKFSGVFSNWLPSALWGLFKWKDGSTLKVFLDDKIKNSGLEESTAVEPSDGGSNEATAILHRKKKVSDQDQIDKLPSGVDFIEVSKFLLGVLQNFESRGLYRRDF